RRIKLMAGSWKAVEGLDPLEIRRRSVQALRGLLASLAARKPLVVWLDDLQWGDADSARLLADVLRPPEAPPFLLVACWRAEDEAASDCVRLLRESLTGAEGGAMVIDVEVGQLTAMEAESLASALLADSETATEAQVATVARESGGWPVYVHELTRHYRAAPADGTRPPTLEELIGDRVRRLPAAARRVLDVLAVAAQPLRAADAQLAADLTA